MTTTTSTGSDGGHGRGFALPEFTHLLPLRTTPGHDEQALAVLAAAMVSDKDAISDGPDPEENLFVPAGYTYFGQFIDHDLTLDTTSTLNRDKDLLHPDLAANDPSNLRSPRFDLDCVYGNGPDDQPYLYVQADECNCTERVYKDASMILGSHDLPRGPNGRALIGDKRNDENSIVNQIQQTFIKFHNQVVRQLVADGVSVRGAALFKRARDQVRWAYQTLITEDYLPRIIEGKTLKDFVDARALQGDEAYLLYKTKVVRGDPPREFNLRDNLPREFVVAAYRFGHSLVRTGYRLNGNAGGEQDGAGTRLPIFTPSNACELSLVGFDPLPLTHVIDDWGRFFPSGAPLPGDRLPSNDGPTFEAPNGYDATPRLQYAYKIDPSLADPLGTPPRVGPSGPPSLALLNLLRGNVYGIRGGQAFADLLKAPLDPKYLVTRVRHEMGKGAQGEDLPPTYTFKPIPASLQTDTPLWFYVLAEAQRHMVDLYLERREQDSNARLTADDMLGRTVPPDPQQRASGTQLGPVGGRIVAEVFYGLLDSDPDSLMHQTGFVPIWGGSGPHTFARLLEFNARKID
jgi:hypothetical protein